MGIAPRLARPHAGLASFNVTLLLAALAFGLAALLLAGPAHAAPGSVVWKKTPDPTKGPDGLSLCARGPSGSLYAVGNAYTNRGDIWITRYKASGAVMWSKRWDDSRHKMDRARAMTVDAAGNVYVCGFVEGTPTVTDSVVLKYSATGQKRWAKVQSFGGFEEASAIGVDSAGNAYVTGHAQPVDGRSSLYVARFAAVNGAVAWTWWEDTADTNSSGLAIAVTPTGTCYAAGTIVALSAASDSSGYLAKVTGGTRDWADSWDGAGGLTDWWEGVALDPAGGVVVAGTTAVNSAGDLFAARYSDAGVMTWHDTWSMTGTYTSDRFEDLAVASDGSIWVCGSSDDYLGSSDIYRGVLVRWSPTGEETSATIGSASQPAIVYNVTLDPSGNAYVAGSILRGASADGLAAKFTPAGTRSWIRYVSLTSKTEDLLEDVAIGPSGTVYATGTLNEGMARNSRAVVLRLKR